MLPRQAGKKRFHCRRLPNLVDNRNRCPRTICNNLLCLNRQLQRSPRFLQEPRIRIMTNKKGLTPTTAIIPIVLILFILAIAFFTLTDSGRSFLERLGILTSITPGTPPNITDEEIFHYSLSDNTVEFYDGTAWHPFTEIPLNGKNFKYDQIKDDFYKYYYLSTKRKEKQQFLFVEKENEISKELSIPQNTFCIETGDFIFSSAGSKVKINLLEGTFENEERVCKKEVLGIFTIDETNYIELLNPNGENIDVKTKWPDTHKEVLDLATTWRDSVFAHPIEIPYTKNGQSISYFTCVTRDHDYLVSKIENQVSDANQPCPK